MYYFTSWPVLYYLLALSLLRIAYAQPGTLFDSFLAFYNKYPNTSDSL